MRCPNCEAQLAGTLSGGEPECPACGWTPNPAPTCDHCDEADATWVGDSDIGDRDGQARVVYALYCDGCKGKSSYMDPEPLTDEWRRRLGK